MFLITIRGNKLIRIERGAKVCKIKILKKMSQYEENDERSRKRIRKEEVLKCQYGRVCLAFLQFLGQRVLM